MSTQKKKLNLYGYKELDTRIKQLELIEESIGEDIETYLYMLEDTKEYSTVEDIRFIMLDLIVANRRSANLLQESIKQFEEMSKRQFTAENNITSDIKINTDENFKKQFAQWR